MTRTPKDKSTTTASTGPAPPPPVSGAQLIRLSDVQTEPITWCWNRYFPLGMVVVVDGDPGLGKSTIVTDVAARVSRGSRMPDGSDGIAAADVIMLSVEDDNARVLKPRLEKAGADLSRVSTIQMHDEHGERMLMLDPNDIAVIENTVVKTSARVVTIDPLMGYLPDNVDSYKDQSIRKVMSHLAALASRQQVLIIAVRHLTKSGEGKALYRGSGSIAIIGAARAAYLLAVDPQDSNKRVLAPTKMNIAQMPPPMSLRIVSDSANDFPKVEWLGTSPITADQLVTQERANPTKLDEATEFLRGELANGSRNTTELIELAADHDISEKTLKRAKQHLGVVSTKRPGFGTDGGWICSLPKKANSHLQDLTPFEQPALESQNHDQVSQRGPNPEPENWPPLAPATNQYNDERGA